MRYASLAVGILSCVFASSAFSQSAPLGLEWSAAADSLRQTGIDLKESGTDAYGVGFSANKLPKVLADQETALLSFGHNDKLWRIVVVSKDFSNDPMGLAVRNRYNDLLGILSEKYGKPKNHHTLGSSIFSEPEYFLAGIQGGKSFWYSDYTTADLNIQIGIVATSSSDARWRIIYEYKALKAVFEQSKRGREKGAL